MEEHQYTHFLATDTPLVGSLFATWTGEQETVRSSRANSTTAALRQSTPSSLTPSTPPTTSWIPLDELASTWAEFGSETAASSLALTATGTAFIALSWEASALRHHTWACQDYAQCRTRNAARWYGQAMEDLTEASRQWSRVVMWLEKLANDEQQCSPAILERTRSLIGQAMAPHPGGPTTSPGCWWRKGWTLPPAAAGQDAVHAASR